MLFDRGLDAGHEDYVYFALLRNEKDEVEKMEVGDHVPGCPVHEEGGPACELWIDPIFRMNPRLGNG